jgi:hypothetical protein
LTREHLSLDILFQFHAIPFRSGKDLNTQAECTLHRDRARHPSWDREHFRTEDERNLGKPPRLG